MVLSSPGRHFLRRNFTQTSWPVVTPPEINGAAAADGAVILPGSMPHRSCEAAIQRAQTGSESSSLITASFLPCSHNDRTGSALLKWATAAESGTDGSRRGGHTATNFDTRILWSLWRRKAPSMSRCSTSSASTCSLTSATVDAVVSINLVATRVTRLRGNVSSDGDTKLGAASVIRDNYSASVEFGFEVGGAAVG